MKIGEIYKATKEDITKFMEGMEAKYGPSLFKSTFEQILTELFVEEGLEIKKSPVDGFGNNIEYLFSQFEGLYPATKTLAETQRAYAESLVIALRKSREEAQDRYLKTSKPANDKPC